MKKNKKADCFLSKAAAKVTHFSQKNLITQICIQRVEEKNVGPAQTRGKSGEPFSDFPGSAAKPGLGGV